jgi:hypothetical protein
MDRVSQKFINRINSTKDLKSLQTELDSLERNANSQYMWNSKEVQSKNGLNQRQNCSINNKIYFIINI